METPAPLDRLVPICEGKRIIGVRSNTTYYALIKERELPPLIKRGRSSFHLESDLLSYVARLAKTREAA